MDLPAQAHPLAPDAPADVRDIPLHPGVPAIPVTGINGALRRVPRCDTQDMTLIGRPGFVPRWKPYWPKPNTVCLTFPEGIELLPAPSSDAADRSALEPLSILNPSAPAPAPAPAPQPSCSSGPAEAGDRASHSRTTRIRPPSDALSLQDRLFYVLQPPLESWLRGQELIMPFEPFPYQYEGIAWLFSQRAALLADEMGLGKTMQAITAIRLLLRAGHVRRVLLICPKPLIPNWQREFRLWAEELPVTVVEGDGPRRRMLWQLPGSLVMLANYELVVRDFQELLALPRGVPASGDGLGRRTAPDCTTALGDDGPDRLASRECLVPTFDLVVLDEAQRIKNRESATSSIARSIPRRRSLCLTGTPIENRPEEMASLFEFLGVIPPRANPDIRQLTRLSQEYVLRRTKDLVKLDLPPRLDRDEIIELSPAQQAAYQQAERDGVVQLNDLGEEITIQHVFELVLRLKQITNYDPLTGESAKLDRLAADMEEIAASGGKAILFSQWTRTLDWLAARLPLAHPLIYHGGVPTRHRESILDQFRRDPQAHLLLMSYGTGAVGLNLQFAGYVFLYDRWWNPAVEDQAINRAHRIGATAAQIIVSKFISKDTIEERIDLVLRQKRELFARVLGEGEHEHSSLSLNASEIFGLFDLKARTRKGDARPIAPVQTDAA